jgi:nucleoside-diphosphate kinase
MVAELTAGPSIAMEIKKSGTTDVVEAFRELCGPFDPQIGAILRPNSLRARFGVDKVISLTIVLILQDQQRNSLHRSTR